jgi:hypothetical protein
MISDGSGVEFFQTFAGQVVQLHLEALLIDLEFRPPVSLL